LLAEAPVLAAGGSQPVDSRLFEQFCLAVLEERNAEALGYVRVLLDGLVELPTMIKTAPRPAPGPLPPRDLLSRDGPWSMDHRRIRPQIRDTTLLACRVLYRLHTHDEWRSWADLVRRLYLEADDEPQLDFFQASALVREGRLREGRLLLEDLVRRQPPISPMVRGLVLSNLGQTLSQLGEFRRSRDLLAESVSLFRHQRNDWLLGNALIGHGLIEVRSFRLDDGAAMLEEAAEMLSSLGCKQSVYLARFNLAIALYKQGRTVESRALCDRIEGGLRAPDNLQAWLQTRLVRCKTHNIDRDHDKARGIAEEVEQATRDRGFQREEGLAIEMKGDAALVAGDLDAAREFYVQAMTMAMEEAPEGDLAAGLKRRLGEVAFLTGDLSGARLQLGEALLASRSAGEVFEAAVSGRLLAAVLHAEGDPGAARHEARLAVERARIHGCTLELARALMAEAHAEASLADLHGDGDRETAWARAAEARTILTRLGFKGERRRCDRFLAGLRETWRAAWVWAGGPPPPESLGDRAESTFVASSPAMTDAAGQMAAAAASVDPVLITGETGTGKEVAARRIHDLGLRQRGPLVSVNCAAIPADLFEREFFGHAAGAFTGADQAAPGLVELAHGGTLFLDELGDLRLELQAKLLRLIQEGTFRRLGDPVERRVDLRIIAATNVDLPARVDDGDFRQDLYYRLGVLEVQLPPLRDRSTDVAQLVESFVRRGLGGEVKASAVLSGRVLSMLERYDWPGNVRELEALVRRACLFSRAGQALPEAMLPEGLREMVDGCEAEPLPGDETEVGMGLADRLAVAERAAIQDALSVSRGNRTRAAKILGISRQALYGKIERLGVG